jgi:hypothetical protein
MVHPDWNVRDPREVAVVNVMAGNRLENFFDRRPVARTRSS